MASDPAVLMQFSEIALDVFLCAFSVCHGAMLVFVFTGVFLAFVLTGCGSAITGMTGVIRGTAGTPPRAGSGSRAGVGRPLFTGEKSSLVQTKEGAGKRGFLFSFFITAWVTLRLLYPR